MSFKQFNSFNYFPFELNYFLFIFYWVVGLFYLNLALFIISFYEYHFILVAYNLLIGWDFNSFTNWIYEI